MGELLQLGLAAHPKGAQPLLERAAPRHKLVEVEEHDRGRVGPRRQLADETLQLQPERAIVQRQRAGVAHVGKAEQRDVRVVRDESIQAALEAGRARRHQRAVDKAVVGMRPRALHCLVRLQQPALGRAVVGGAVCVLWIRALWVAHSPRPVQRRTSTSHNIGRADRRHGDWLAIGQLAAQALDVADDWR